MKLFDVGDKVSCWRWCRKTQRFIGEVGEILNYFPSKREHHVKTEGGEFLYHDTKVNLRKLSC